ncbi:MAG: hypothetical protein O7E52_28940 [Candidatus Poribacteria bacterium]|nr:hypothetical protein [Candidatus Poribacteria bacterium]
MTCREFLKRIAAYPSASLRAILDGEAQADAHGNLLKHLSSCPTCAKKLSVEWQFRTLVKRHAPKVEAPEGLMDKVLDLAALEGLSESAGPRPREPKLRLFGFSPIRLFAYSMAALCVGALAVLFASTPWRAEQSAIFEMVDDHIRYLPSNERKQIVSSSRAEVEAWFTAQLDFAVRIPEFPTLQLLGGRRCYLFGQRVALLFYEGANRNVSLFILEDRDLNLDAMSWMDYKDQKIGLAACKGYHLVFCRQSGLAYALVSDLPPEMLLDLTAQL